MNGLAISPQPHEPRHLIERTETYLRDHGSTGRGVALTFLRPRDAFTAPDAKPERYTVVGRVARYSPDSSGRDAVLLYGGGSSATWLRYFDAALLVDATVVDAAEVAAKAYHDVGSRVVVRKYAGDYVGRVIERRRTNLVVAFTTNGGKAKQVTVNALDLVPAHGRPRR